MALIEKLTNIGNAVRTATNSTEELTLDQMAEKIAVLVDVDTLPACEEVEW